MDPYLVRLRVHDVTTALIRRARDAKSDKMDEGTKKRNIKKEVEVTYSQRPVKGRPK